MDEVALASAGLQESGNWRRYSGFTTGSFETAWAFVHDLCSVGVVLWLGLQ